MSSGAQLPLHGSLIGPAFSRAGLKNLFGLFAGTPPQVATEPMLRDKLHELLSATLRNANYDPDIILRPVKWFDDSRYYLPTKGEVETLIAACPTCDLGKEADLFDCEDFAYTFRGFSAQHRFIDSTRKNTMPFAIGMLWGRGFAKLGPLPHALNLVVLDDRSVRLIDTMPGGLGTDLVPLAPGVGAELRYAII